MSRPVSHADATAAYLITRSIERGDLDRYLEEIAAAVRDRQNAVRVTERTPRPA